MGIELYIWGHYIGALTKSPEGIAFQYDPEFKKLNLELSPLNLPIDGKNVYINEADWKAEWIGLDKAVGDDDPNASHRILTASSFI